VARVVAGRRDHDEPLAMQLDYAAQLAHMTLPYPDITT